MAARRVYTATMAAACWREHTCNACGCTFRAFLETKATRDYSDLHEAQRAAIEAAEDLLAAEVARQPCPSCGLYQPDMALHGSIREHWQWSVFPAIVIIPLALVAGPQPAGSIARDILTLGVTAACAVTAVAQIRIALRHPNADLVANRTTAGRAIAQGRLRMLTQGILDSTTVKHWQFRNRHLRLLACLAMIIGTILTSAGIVFVHAHAWPVNERVIPPVVGPGDAVTLPVSGSITSIQGLWRGRARAEMANADELGLRNRRLPATSNTDVWQESIPNDYLAVNTVHPWARVLLPDSDILAGRQIWIQVDIDTRYPDVTGVLLFRNADTVLSDVVGLQLAEPHAALIAATVGISGLAIGIALIVGTGFLLRRLALRESGLALPSHTVSVIEDPGPAGE